MPSSPMLSPGVSPDALQLHPKPDKHPSPISLDEPAPTTSTEWSTHPSVLAVRADWRAMSVVHFILVFRSAIAIEETRLLDCLPERAVAFACRASSIGESAAKKPKPESTSRLAPFLVEDEDEAEVEDVDGTPAPSLEHSPSSDGSPTRGAGFDIEERYAAGDSEAAPLFDALIKFLCGEKPRGRDIASMRKRVLEAQDLPDRVELLKDLVDDAAEFPSVRSIISPELEKGGPKAGRRRPRGAMGDDIPAGVRITYGGRDGNGARYLWVRGLDGCCSGRIEKVRESSAKGVVECSGTVMEGHEVAKLAEGLEFKAGALRTQRVCGAWLREKAKRAEVRKEKMCAEARLALERAEKAKLRLLGSGEVRVDGVVVSGDGFGRGRRTRGVVTYQEDDDDAEDVASSEEEEDEEGEDEEDEDWDQAAEEVVEREDADAVDESSDKDPVSVDRMECGEGEKHVEEVGDVEEVDNIEEVEEVEEVEVSGQGKEAKSILGNAIVQDVDEIDGSKNKENVDLEVGSCSIEKLEPVKETSNVVHLPADEDQPVKLGARRYRAPVSAGVPSNQKRRLEVRRIEKSWSESDESSEGDATDASDRDFIVS